MALNDTVTVDAAKWHRICHELGFDQDRKEQFQECFNCTVTWKSRLNERSGPPAMELKFVDPVNATMFVLNWL